MSEEKKTETKTTYYKVLLYIVIVLTPIVIWLFSINYVSMQVDNQATPSTLWSIRGQYGDSFGSVNALFSGLAFAGIIITILLQSQELKLQREELKLTRDEMRDTRKEFETQNNTLITQRFETTFFHLMDLHTKIVDDIGKRPFFTRACDNFDRLKTTPYNSPNSYSVLEINFDLLFQNSQLASVNLYLSSLLRIIEYVHSNQSLTPEQKQFYYSIIISNLSEHESTFILYYLALSRYSNDLIDRFIEINKLDGFIQKLNPRYYHATHSIFKSILAHKKELIQKGRESLHG